MEDYLRAKIEVSSEGWILMYENGDLAGVSPVENESLDHKTKTRSQNDDDSLPLPSHIIEKFASLPR